MTRRKGPPAGMIRFVVGPDDAVCPDIRARLPGRGAWVEATKETVRLAVKRRSFPRAFRRDCAAVGELADRVDALLELDCLQALGFANKAGQVVCGNAKVEAALGAGGVRALLHATEASPDGIRKLAAAARRNGDGPLPSPVQIFSVDQLDLALGRSHVIHAALLAGGASDAFLARAARLERYRAVQGVETGLAPRFDAAAGEP